MSEEFNIEGRWFPVIESMKDKSERMKITKHTFAYGDTIMLDKDFEEITKKHNIDEFYVVEFKGEKDE